MSSSTIKFKAAFALNIHQLLPGGVNLFPSCQVLPKSWAVSKSTSTADLMTANSGWAADEDYRQDFL